MYFFLYVVQSDSGNRQVYHKRNSRRSFRGGKDCRSVKLTTSHHLVRKVLPVTLRDTLSFIARPICF
jgi:hypothetical protein